MVAHLSNHSFLDFYFIFFGYQMDCNVNHHMSRVIAMPC